MPYLLNLIYLLVLIGLSPWLLYKALTTGKYRRGLWTKFTGRVFLPPTDSRKITVWFHGVSVGEIHLLRGVVAAYRKRHPERRCVISTSTDTGMSEARKAFPELAIFYWPLDFTWAVRAALRRVNPATVVLAEGEIWPNFVRCAHRRGVKLAIINGRMSPRSALRYAKFSWLTRGILEYVDICAVQTDEYARSFETAGAQRVTVTGNVKYDGATSYRCNPRTLALRELFGIHTQELVWVAGSTQDPEEEIVLEIYRRALTRHPNLRLILVPRQKERFAPVADLLKCSGLPFIRRSEISDSLPAKLIPAPSSSVILQDKKEL